MTTSSRHFLPVALVVAARAVLAAPPIEVDVSKDRDLGVGFGHLEPGGHDLQLHLTTDDANDIRRSKVSAGAGESLWKPSTNDTPADEHIYEARGIVPSKEHAVRIVGVLKGSGGPGGGHGGPLEFDATVASIDIDVDSTGRHLGDSWPPLPADDPKADYEDALEINGGMEVPITNPGLPNNLFPASFPINETSGKALRLNVQTLDPGTITFSGTGEHVAVYRVFADGETSEYRPVTEISVTAPGIEDEELRLHTKTGFTGNVTVTATFTHADEATESAKAIDSVLLKQASSAIQMYVNAPTTSDDYIAIEPFRVPVTVTMPEGGDPVLLATISDPYASLTAPVKFYSGPTGNDPEVDGVSSRDISVLEGSSKILWISIDEDHKVGPGGEYVRKLQLTPQGDPETVLAELTLKLPDFRLLKHGFDWGEVGGHAGATAELKRPSPGTLRTFYTGRLHATETDAPLQVEFQLEEVSKHPGQAMNFPQSAGDEHDLRFVDQPHFHPPSLDGQVIREIEDDSNRPRSGEAFVFLAAWDYAPTGSVRATLHVTTVGLPLASVGGVQAIDDEDDDGINDAWESAFPAPPGGNEDPDDDGDSLPAGDGTAGERLARWEEYRGFLVLGEFDGGIAEPEYASLDPRQKDVFLWDDLGHAFADGNHGLTLFSSFSPNVAMVDGSLVGTNARINFNGGVLTQRAIRVESAEYSANTDDGGSGGSNGVTKGAPPSEYEFCRVAVDEQEAGATRLLTDLLAGETEAAFFDGTTDHDPRLKWMPDEKDGHVRIDSPDGGFEIFEFGQCHGSYSSFATCVVSDAAVPKDSTTFIVNSLPESGFQYVMVDDEVIKSGKHVLKFDGLQLVDAISDDEGLNQLKISFGGISNVEVGQYHYIRVGAPPTHEWMSFTSVEVDGNDLLLKGIQRKLLDSTQRRGFMASTPVLIPLQFYAERGQFGTEEDSHDVSRPVRPAGVWANLGRGVGGMEMDHPAATHVPIRDNAYVDTFIRAIAAHEAAHACMEGGEDVEHEPSTIMQETFYLRGSKPGKGFFTNFVNATRNQFIAR